MPSRRLSAATVQVLPGREAEYLRLLARLAARWSERGVRTWLFRDPDAPGRFLEFRESVGSEGHPIAGPITEEERVLTAALEAAVDAQGGDRLWEEVRLPHIEE